MSNKRTVLVTGASRNIGAHLARKFASSGFNVVLCARSSEVRQVAAEISEAGGSALAVTGDVRSAESVRVIVHAAEETFGGIDVLVNNAVVRVQRPFLDMSADEWKMTLDVSLDGAFHCSRAVLPGMMKRGWGRILNVAGISGQTGAAERAGVVTAKSGLIGLTKALAREFGSFGVTVNTISPGSIGTDRGVWTAIGDVRDIEKYYRGRVAVSPLGRMGSLDEICNPCLFLVSDDAGYITGQTLSVNGGRWMA